jgi:hypothetical protein
MGLSEILAAIFSMFKRAPGQYDGTNGCGYQPVVAPAPRASASGPLFSTLCQLYGVNYSGRSAKMICR